MFCWSNFFIVWNSFLWDTQSLSPQSAPIKDILFLSAAIKSENLSLETAKKVGEVMGDKLKELGISEAVFDRGGYIYHGRVKAVAEAIREKGINF